MLKRNTKNIVVVLLVLTLIASLAGCSKKVENTTSTNERGYTNSDSIVTAKELKEMNDDNVVVIGVMVKGKYIPGSVNFEEKDFNAEINGVPDMRPEAEKWAETLSNYGIEEDDTIVIYDAKNMLLSSRVWWVFKYYGHENVKILDGGIEAWKSAEYNTESSPAERKATKYEIKGENKKILATLDDVKTSYDNEKIVTLDTRTEKEYKNGHVPATIWIEWTKALNEDGTFKNGEELKKLYEEKGITSDKELIMPYCQGAWRAANSMFVLQELLGYENVKLYDGSWAEYGEIGEPIEK